MIRLHYGPMFSDVVGAHGLPRDMLVGMEGRFAEIQRDIEGRRDGGEYGFFSLVSQPAVLQSISEFAGGVGQAFDHVLVLGIGGSALGTRTLVEALRPPAWNELSDEQRDYFPRLTVLDNVDPSTVASALRRIDPRRVLVNVVSKSGGTAETLAQFLCVREWLEAALGDDAARTHLVFTTDPKGGPLREIAEREGIPALDVPPNVGGRFSVLSPVGLLPAALVGIDIEALLRGASRAVERCSTATLRENPAALYAALQHAADTEMGAGIHVFMTYSDRLRSLGEWFRQLWAESLGKAVSREGRTVHAGPTPLAALGATDQHSQVQLFVEGPFDKTITVVAVRDHGVDATIPAADGLPDGVAYLGGHSLGELLETERLATMQALKESGRMHCLLDVPVVDDEHVGELLMLLQIATVYAGAWYGIDPLGQPGVERGKQLTYGALGRPGFEAPRLLPPDADWV